MTEAIRLIHTGDLHIGVQNYGRMDSATGYHTRLKDFLSTLDKLVDYAVSNETDAVLICGDVFKNREPDVTQQREFAKRIKRLADSGVFVYIIVGNHDLHNAAGKATSVEIYDVLDMPGVTVRRKPEIDVIRTKRGSLQVIALPYLSPSNLSVEGTTIEEISLDIRNKIGKMLEALVARMDRTLPTVVMSHFSLIGAAPGSEKSILMGREIMLPVSFFNRPEFDYVAFGHIHKHQVLWEEPPVVYCGSLDRVDFNEEKEEKGFVEVFLRRGEAQFEFVPLDTRPFKTLYIDAREGDPYEKALEAVEREDLKEAIVKLKVMLPADKLSSLRERELYRLLREKAFYVAGIEKQITSDNSRTRYPGINEQMDLEEAVAEYISKKEEYRPIQEKLLAMNKELIAELKGEGIL